MANYGETMAYWYFRLNGFFPLKNFVIHRTENIKYPSDCDVLAIRPPHVYEPIGGNQHDWDQRITASIDFSKTIGIVCEVKTGHYTSDTLFPTQSMEYCIGRLGLFPRDSVGRVSSDLNGCAYKVFPNNTAIAKVLISNRNQRERNDFIQISLDEIEMFLKARIEHYPKEKFGDRMMFNSDLIQSIIDRYARTKV
jgi:hypothetical protein